VEPLQTVTVGPTQAVTAIRGPVNIVASRQAYPGRPATYEVHRVVGAGDTRTVEMTLRFDGTDPHALVAVVDLHNGRIARERIYIAESWDPPAYRAQWVERF
jgi:hypothetical protein